MRKSLVPLLACPACGDGHFDLVIHTAHERTRWAAEIGEGDASAETEVEKGVLNCRDCSASFLITTGIPRLLPPGTADGPPTGHRLTTFEGAVAEHEENFRDLLGSVAPIAHGGGSEASSFLGKRVLDAGCGFGRHAAVAARWGAEVVALDSSTEAVESAAKNLAGMADVVQGDVNRPPFRPESFDHVYSFGVLHHVPHPAKVFSSLHALVRPGGRLSLWVYGPRQGMTRVATGALHGAAANMSSNTLYRFSQGVTTMLRLFSHTPYRVLSPIPGAAGVVSHLPGHDHARWPYDVVVADVYDRLRVPVTHYFPGEVLERWYTDAGYLDTRVTRRVRNTESFRATGIKR
jgi:SAM-dependent methyltransferase